MQKQDRIGKQGIVIKSVDKDVGLDGLRDKEYGCITYGFIVIGSI